MRGEDPVVGFYKKCFGGNESCSEVGEGVVLKTTKARECCKNRAGKKKHVCPTRGKKSWRTGGHKERQKSASVVPRGIKRKLGNQSHKGRFGELNSDGSDWKRGEKLGFGSVPSGTCKTGQTTCSFWDLCEGG